MNPHSHRLPAIIRILATFAGVGIVVMGVGFAAVWVDAILIAIRDGTVFWNRLLLAPVLVAGSWVKARDFLGAAWTGTNLRELPPPLPWRTRAR